MSPEAMLEVLDTLVKTKVKLEEAKADVSEAIDILITEMKAANILHHSSTP